LFEHHYSEGITDSRFRRIKLSARCGFGLSAKCVSAHIMFRGMDAIDYEPDSSLIDGADYTGDDYYEYGDDGGSDEELEACGEETEDYPDSSDDESERFARNDLRNPKSFPAFAECAPIELYSVRDDNNQPIPPPRHWCYLGEIVEHMTSLIRNALTVEDKKGQRTHLSSNFDLEAQFQVRVGSTIAILYAERKHFAMGVLGLRLDHAKFVKVSSDDGRV
jgi:hypothetical protein